MLVFIFLLVFILIILPIVIILLSTIKIVVKDLIISNQNKGKIIKNYEIHFKLYFLNKIKILNIKVDETLINKLNLKEKIDKMDFSKVKKDIPDKKELKILFKKLDFELSNLDLKIELGIDDVILTSAIVALISALIGIGLSKVVKKYDSKNYRYIINPLYINKNIIKVIMNCIIQVKMVHIIYIIYILLKRRRVHKHERTSNRRSYDYSYE